MNTIIVNYIFFAYYLIICFFLNFDLFSGCKNLIMQCLQFDGKNRCTLEQILNHPWMKGDELTNSNFMFYQAMMDHGKAPSVLSSKSQTFPHLFRESKDLINDNTKHSYNDNLMASYNNDESNPIASSSADETSTKSDKNNFRMNAVSFRVVDITWNSRHLPRRYLNGQCESFPDHSAVIYPTDSTPSSGFISSSSSFRDTESSPITGPFLLGSY